MAWVGGGSKARVTVTLSRRCPAVPGAQEQQELVPGGNQAGWASAPIEMIEMMSSSERASGRGWAGRMEQFWRKAAPCGLAGWTSASSVLLRSGGAAALVSRTRREKWRRLSSPPASHPPTPWHSAHRGLDPRFARFRASRCLRTAGAACLRQQHPLYSPRPRHRPPRPPRPYHPPRPRPYRCAPR